jgi:hypothetical protein
LTKLRGWRRKDCSANAFCIPSSGLGFLVAVDLAAQHRPVAVYEHRDFVDAGA